MNKLEKMRTKYLLIPDESVRNIAYRKIPTKQSNNWSEYIKKNNLANNVTLDFNRMIEMEIIECLRS